MRHTPARILFTLACATATATAQDATPAKLRVGTKHTPPFAIKNEDGSWSGMSITLWERVAAALGLDFEYVELDLAGLLEGVENGELDVVAAALTMTPDREQRFDFSHAFYHSGLGIAIDPHMHGTFLSALAEFPWAEFGSVLGVLVLVLFLAGVAVWLFERRRNPDQFGGRHGMWSGFWWSAVTMTTVGYGDKAPVTLAGRLVGLVWMFASLFMISAFTATFASVMTTARLSRGVSGVEDLPRARVATVDQSTGASFLDRRRIPFKPFEDAESALVALRDGSVDAVVYDAPILQYLASKEMSGVAEVLPARFVPQQYALALGPSGPTREDVNRVLLGVLDTDAWDAAVKRELGEDP